MVATEQNNPDNAQPEQDRPFAAVRGVFAAWETVDARHGERHASSMAAVRRHLDLTDDEREQAHRAQDMYLRGLMDGMESGMGTTREDVARLCLQRDFLQNIEDRAHVIIGLLGIKNNSRREIIGMARDLLDMARAIRTQHPSAWPNGWHETDADADSRRKLWRAG